MTYGIQDLKESIIAVARARQTVRNAMPALHAPRRKATELEEAVTERAEEAQAQGFVLIYFMDAETKEFTGFSRIHKPEK